MTIPVLATDEAHPSAAPLAAIGVLGERGDELKDWRGPEQWQEQWQAAQQEPRQEPRQEPP